MAKIIFYGAARQVTGSNHIIESNGYKVMLDCGMQQGKRKESYERNKNFPYNPGEVNDCILTHAHIDHSGNVPTAMVRGFDGKVYSTYATRDLCELMLPDSAYIQEKDLEYVNKKRKKQGKVLFELLYDMRWAEKAIEHFVPKNLGEYFNLNDNIQAFFINAGHILGSGMVVVKIKEGDRVIKIGYTGDLGRKNLPVLKDPDKLYDIDYLIIESTYGGKDHGSVKTAFGRLSEIIKRTYKNGGKIIIPVLAVDIPSGLDCDTGAADGPAVKADLTVTFLARKKGFDSERAGQYTGKVVVADIGISGEAATGAPEQVNTNT